MNIGLIIYGGLETISGGFLYDRKLVGYLHRQGDQVQVISLPRRTYGRHLLDNLSRDLFERLQGLQLDVLLQDELNHPSLFWMNRRLKENSGYRIFSIVHHLRSSELRPLALNFLYRKIEQRYLQTVDGFIFNSQTTHRVVEGLVGNSRPGLVAYPGGDRFQPELTEKQISLRASQRGPLRLVFLGNVIRRKGLHELLCALKTLPGSSYQLSIAGSLEADRPYVHRLFQQVEREGLSGRVHFLGQLADAELGQLFAESHVLAVPSSYEGFGIVYLEGMSYGLPAIATSAGAAREVITHGNDGFLVETGEVQALSEYLTRLAFDRDLLVAMSLAARSRFLAHPTWEQSMSGVRSFLQTCLES